MYLDITNQKFNKYTAIKYLGNSMWECKCDCGNIRKVNSWNLRNNVCKSCGCLVKEKKQQKNKKENFIIYQKLEFIEYIKG